MDAPAVDLVFTGDPTTFQVGIPNRDMSAAEVAAHPLTLAELLAAGQHTPRHPEQVPDSARTLPKREAPRP